MCQATGELDCKFALHQCTCDTNLTQYAYSHGAASMHCLSCQRSLCCITPQAVMVNYFDPEHSAIFEGFALS